MKDLKAFNITMRFSLELSCVADNENLTRYQVKLIDIDQDDDKQNPLWTIELIRGETYSLAYQQILANELIMFGSFNDCLNHIHSESRTKIARLEPD